MRTLALFAPVLSMLACSTTATIYTKDGTPVEGYIQRGDPSFVYVRGCRNVYKREGGKLREVELHCNADDKAEARKTFTYDEKGRRNKVEIDICDDGTVDKQFRYVTVVVGSEVKRRKKGDKSAGDKMSLETVKNTPCYPEPTPIPRTDILDIDHPGNIHAIIGTPIAIGGWAYVVWGIIYHFMKCRPLPQGGCLDTGFESMLVGLLVAAPGTIVSVFGWNTWASSRIAASPTVKAQAGPMVFTDGSRWYHGLGVAWEW